MTRKRMLNEEEWTSISVPQSVFDRFDRVYRSLLDLDVKIKKYELIDLMCQMMDILLEISSKVGETPSSVFESSLSLYTKSLGLEFETKIKGERDEIVKTF